MITQTTPPATGTDDGTKSLHPAQMTLHLMMLVFALGLAGFLQGQKPESGPAIQVPEGLIAFMWGGVVRTIDPETCKEQILTTDVYWNRPLTFSRDGREINFWGHDAGWNIWSVSPGQAPRNLTRTTGGDCRSVAASPDGRSLAFMRSSPPGLWTMSRDGREMEHLSPRGHRDNTPSWSPDSKKLLYLDLEPGSDPKGRGPDRLVLRIYDLRDGQDTDIVSALEGVFAPDGRAVIFSLRFLQKGEIRQLDPETNTTEVLYRGAGTPHSLRLHLKTRRLLFWMGQEDGSTDLMVLEPGTRICNRLAIVRGRTTPPSWSPDGRWAVFSIEVDQVSTLWLIELETRRLVKLPIPGAWPEWRPN